MSTTGRYNYYEILELATNVPQHEVSVAYDRAKATYSGDNPAIYTIFSEHEARELLAMIEEAYAVLGNKTLRGIYDQRLFAGQNSAMDLSLHSIMTASRTVYPEAKAEEAAVQYKVDEATETWIREKTDWTGEDLRKVREYKGLSLDRLSEKTKIKSFYLNALEKMDPAELPAQVFIRGYAVQTAKALVLDDKLVADSYMKAFRAKNGV